MKQRCSWINTSNSEIYINYHDNEWGVPSYDDTYLFEMILLESFHCGLSWLLILNKRENFRTAFDNFDPNIISNYGEEKITELINNKDIVRHRGKIVGNIENAKAFLKIQQEFGTFSKYIWSFTNGEVVYNNSGEFLPRNELSDKVSKDMKKRGFKFMGSVTTYSYLEAIGVMNNHSKDCFKANKS